MKRSLIFCLTFVFVASTVYSQEANFGALARPTVEAYSFNMIGAGARSIGMGGAYYGVSDDVTAASWNPAGLVAIEEPAMSVSYRNFGAGGQYRFGGYPPFAPARDFATYSRTRRKTPSRISSASRDTSSSAPPPLPGTAMNSSNWVWIFSLIRFSLSRQVPRRPSTRSASSNIRIPGNRAAFRQSTSVLALACTTSCP